MEEELRDAMTAEQQEIDGYAYPSEAASHSHDYLYPAVRQILREKSPEQPVPRIFDLGCGNGSVARRLAQEGFDVTGVDPSKEGIARANSAAPHLKLHVGSAYDDLAARFGRFQIVLSLEVVEHVYFPRHFARTLYDLVEPGGQAIVSTPYHGYLKNLALALTGRMDAHFTALWDHGHIKFWSRRTLTALLEEAGFRDVQFRRVGRIPPLAKSMIAVAKK